MLRNLILPLALAGAMLNTEPAAAAELPTVQLMDEGLKSGRLAQLEDDLKARLGAIPADDQARFALGATQFLMAVEHLAQAMYRHGLEAPRGLQRELPFFRFPVPHNPAPEPLSYDEMRAMFQTAVSEFATAEATLAKISDDNVKLPVAINLVRLDLDGDDKAAESETLWRVLSATLAGGRLDPEASEALIIAFDRADVAWLRGYTHLLSAMIEFALAHDGKESFDASFHLVFPRAGLPNQILGAQPRRADEFLDFGSLADAVAFIHLMHWPVTEPERRAAALAHLESVVALSRESWTFILAETDDEAEWIPSPAQKNGVMPGAAVTQQTVDGWMAFLGEFEAILKGQKLIPHWRLTKGISFRRAMLEEKVFDPILWAQGSAALPYLEDGPKTDAQTWERIMQMLEGNFLGYVVWFN